MKGHVFLDTKNRGPCKRLTGNVMLTVILVDDKESTWTKEDMEEFRRDQMRATAKLLKDARFYQTNLKINVQYMRCKIDTKFVMSEQEKSMKKAVEACGFKNEKTVIPLLKKKHQVEEAPVIFAINRPGRSFAQPQIEDDEFEYCVLYRLQGDYRHELYHIFGAKDFYYPKNVEDSAIKYFPKSIMRISGDAETDPLTAYLIGWTDELTYGAKKFLEETAWMTREDIEKVLDGEVTTGKGTIRYSEGDYTGDLVEGAPHGKGKLVWDSGATYDGEWKDGYRHGKGTLTWTNNTIYEGDWVYGEMQGYGVCTFPDGTKQSGRWEKGAYKGR